jgi:hypothetical protein
VPELVRRKPLPDNPEVLRALLEEVTRYLEHFTRIIATAEAINEADRRVPPDRVETDRQLRRLLDLLGRDPPPIRNLADHIDWPFADGGPLRLDDYRRWQTQSLARTARHFPDVARENGRVFEVLRRRLLAKLNGDPDPETTPEPDVCPVQLFGQARRPIVLNREQPKVLTPAQYPVIEALALVYPRRIGLGELIGHVKKLTNKKKGGSPHKRLEELEKIEGSDWPHVIIRPVRKGCGGSGLGWPTSPLLAITRS